MSIARIRHVLIVEQFGGNIAIGLHNNAGQTAEIGMKPSPDTSVPSIRRVRDQFGTGSSAELASSDEYCAYSSLSCLELLGLAGWLELTGFLECR